MFSKPPQRYSRLSDQSEFEAVWACGPEAVAFFDAIVAREGVRMAAMLACRKAPTTGVDDRMVMANEGNVEKTFRGCPEMLALYRKNYRAKTGEDLPADAVVYRGLVEYPGDPRAVVTHKNSLQSVQEYARERGRDVQGDWEVVGDQVTPTPQIVRMAPDIVQRYMNEYRQEQPDTYRNVSDADLKEEVIYQHTKLVTADDVRNAPTTLEQCAKVFKDAT